MPTTSKSSANGTATVPPSKSGGAPVGDQYTKMEKRSHVLEQRPLPLAPSIPSNRKNDSNNQSTSNASAATAGTNATSSTGITSRTTVPGGSRTSSTQPFLGSSSGHHSPQHQHRTTTPTSTSSSTTASALTAAAGSRLASADNPFMARYRRTSGNGTGAAPTPAAGTAPGGGSGGGRHKSPEGMAHTYSNLSVDTLEKARERLQPAAAPHHALVNGGGPGSVKNATAAAAIAASSSSNGAAAAGGGNVNPHNNNTHNSHVGGVNSGSSRSTVKLRQDATRRQLKALVGASAPQLPSTGAAPPNLAMVSVAPSPLAPPPSLPGANSPAHAGTSSSTAGTGLSTRTSGKDTSAPSELQSMRDQAFHLAVGSRHSGSPSKSNTSTSAGGGGGGATTGVPTHSPSTVLPRSNSNSNQTVQRVNSASSPNGVNATAAAAMPTGHNGSPSSATTAARQDRLSFRSMPRSPEAHTRDTTLARRSGHAVQSPSAAGANGERSGNILAGMPPLHPPPATSSSTAAATSAGGTASQVVGRTRTSGSAGSVTGTAMVPPMASPSTTTTTTTTNHIAARTGSGSLKREGLSFSLMENAPMLGVGGGGGGGRRSGSSGAGGGGGAHAGSTATHRGQLPPRYAAASAVSESESELSSLDSFFANGRGAEKNGSSTAAAAPAPAPQASRGPALPSSTSGPSDEDDLVGKSPMRVTRAPTATQATLPPAPAPVPPPPQPQSQPQEGHRLRTSQLPPPPEPHLQDAGLQTSDPHTQPQAMDHSTGGDAAEAHGTTAVPFVLVAEEEAPAKETFQRSQEWLQIPNLFYLFANIIELQELLQHRRDAEARETLKRQGGLSGSLLSSWDGEREAQLASLLNHISYSMLEVDGVLLNAFFASWSQKTVRSVVAGVVDSWKRYGPESTEFDYASLRLVDTISADVSATVTYTPLFMLREWVGDAAHLVPMSIINAVLAVVGILCIVFMGVFGRSSLTACIVLSVVLGIVIILFYALSMLALHHNAYADATATFFREEALALTKTVINQDAENSFSEIQSELWSTPTTSAMEPPHRANERETTDSLAALPQRGWGRRGTTEGDEGYVSMVGRSMQPDDPAHREQLEGDRQNALLMTNLNYDKHQKNMQDHQEQVLRQRMDVSPLMKDVNELAYSDSGRSGGGGRYPGQQQQHQQQPQRQQQPPPPPQYQSQGYGGNDAGAGASHTSSANRLRPSAENNADLVADLSKDLCITALVWCRDDGMATRIATSLWPHQFLVCNAPLPVLDSVYRQGSERFKVFLLHAAELREGTVEYDTVLLWLQEKRPVFFFSANVGSFPSEVPVSARLEVPLTERDLNTLLLSGMGIDEEVNATPQATQPFKVPPYSLGRRLGGGAYGNVFEAEMEDTGAKCAVKRMYLREDEEDGDVEGAGPSSQLREIAQEVEIMSSLNHPNIVKYMFCERDDNCISIFMELCSGGALTAMINDSELTDPAVVRRVLTDIISAVAYLHNKRIVHRDLKPDNVLFRDGRAKVTDFGTAVLKRDRGDLRLVKGTFAYMAPEILCGEPYGKACDVWSIGCIAAEVLCVALPQRALGLPEMCEYYRSMDTQSALEIECAEPIVKEFLCACLQRNPAARMTAGELLQHDMLRPENTGLDRWMEVVNETRRLNSHANRLQGFAVGGSAFDLHSEANDSLQSSQILTPP